MQEQDLEEGGIGEELITVRLIQDPGPPSRAARNLGFTVGSSYCGKIIPAEEELEDDGSSVEELEINQDEQSCLFITQEEWASSGLTVKEGRVQIPAALVRGVAVGKDRPRLSFSLHVCQEMGEETFVCLDCDDKFSRLSELLEHSETHDGAQALSLLPTLECSEADMFDPSDEPELSDALLQEQELMQKFQKLKSDLDVQDAKRFKLEFKAFVHKEQFKEFINDVPTLERPFQCVECCKTFVSAQELWGHQVSVGSQTFDCNYGDCTEIFLKLSDFAVHYAAHAGHELTIPQDTGGKKTLNITCPVCGTVVTGLYKLQRHKMRHDSELKYKCPACPKQFVKANTLRKHISTIHKGDKSQKECHLCDKVVYGSSGLLLHLRQTHGIVGDDYFCSTCNLTLPSEGKLKKHQAQHCKPLQTSQNKSLFLEETDPSQQSG